MSTRTIYHGTSSPADSYTNEHYTVNLNGTRHEVRIATYPNGSTANIIKYMDNYGEWWSLHPDEEQAKQVMAALAADRDAAVAEYDRTTVRY